MGGVGLGWGEAPTWMGWGGGHDGMMTVGLGDFPLSDVMADMLLFGAFLVLKGGISSKVEVLEIQF